MASFLSTLLRKRASHEMLFCFFTEHKSHFFYFGKGLVIYPPKTQGYHSPGQMRPQRSPIPL